jgi:hypothetical protein
VAMKKAVVDIEAGQIHLVCVHCCYDAVSMSPVGTYLLSRITHA